jgi:hypothetical protein
LVSCCLLRLTKCRTHAQGERLRVAKNRVACARDNPRFSSQSPMSSRNRPVSGFNVRLTQARMLTSRKLHLAEFAIACGCTTWTSRLRNCTAQVVHLTHPQPRRCWRTSPANRSGFGAFQTASAVTHKEATDSYSHHSAAALAPRGRYYRVNSSFDRNDVDARSSTVCVRFL